MAPRPGLPAQDTFDATQLKGSIGEDGIANLRTDQPHTSGSADKSAEGEQSKSGASTDDSEDSIEDYDQLELDPDTLVANSRKSMDAGWRPSSSGAGADGEDSRQQPESPSKSKKRHSIQISLERTEQKGRYVLTAEDPVVKDLLRKGLEREDAENTGKQQKTRTRIRDLVFTRQFTTFDRQNPSASQSPFFGFFTLFWIAMVLLFVQFCMHNYRDYGSILGTNQMMGIMFSHDVLVLGLTDGAMFAATGVSFFIQKLVLKGWLRWDREGWIIQNLWQSLFLGSVVGWTYFREWPWTHTVFIVLHGLVFLMKMHSFAFYNGYLSGIYRRRRALERKLKQLEQLEPLNSPPTSPGVSSSTTDLPSTLELRRVGSRGSASGGKRPSMPTRTTTNFASEKSDVASVAGAIESGSAINVDQMATFSRIIKDEIADLTQEIQGKSADGRNAYPKNLNMYDFYEYVCLPTLVYELEYPRQEHINWWYVLEKTTATFGVLFVMMVISQAFIYPPVAKTVRMKEAGMPIDQRWREFPFIVSDMLFPLLIEQLLTWYLIWECILNVLAELTCFADRGFYGPWWNSVTWDQYARDWNRPVHNFLLRHVYHSSISTFHLSRNAATFVTFLLSALVHEMVMAVMFKKVRGYLFWSQLLQMPLVAFSRLKFMRERVILGNVVFWIGLFVGPSFLTSLYLVI